MFALKKNHSRVFFDYRSNGVTEEKPGVRYKASKYQIDYNICGGKCKDMTANTILSLNKLILFHPSQK